MGFAWSEVILATRREAAIPMEQFSRVAAFMRVVQHVGGLERRTVQPLGARHVEVGFVDGRHFHQRRESMQHLVDLGRALAVALGMAVDEDRLRAQFVRGAQRHGGMHAEFARGVRCGRDHAALVGRPPTTTGLPLREGSYSSSTDTKNASISTWK